MLSVMSGFFQVLKDWIQYDAERDFYSKYNPSLVEASEVIFRRMKKSDIDAVLQIENAAYEFPWEPQTFRDCFRVNYICWVAEKLGHIQAYGIASVGAGESHVLNVCVSPAVQGKGYGRAMMENLMRLARDKGAEMMMLEVRPSNENALHLYLDLGFNEIGQRKGYYPASKGREDALVLARTL
jgi:[ribosomal protein S18]-alanine N-acetyltransferase